MKKKILMLGVVFTMIACADENTIADNQSEDNREEVVSTKLPIDAKKDDAGHLVGVANREMLTSDNQYNAWFDKGYKNYEPTATTIQKLASVLSDVKIRAYMGTWCPDSQREIPKLYKVLDLVKFDYNNLDMITVNYSKTANGLEEGYDLKYVPTFILYKDGKELGRFVEKPTKKALENDLYYITTENDYKPYR